MGEKSASELREERRRRGKKEKNEESRGQTFDRQLLFQKSQIKSIYD